MNHRSLVYSVAKQMVLHRPSSAGVDEAQLQADGSLWDIMARATAQTLQWTIEKRQQTGCDCPDCLIADLDEQTHGDLDVLQGLTNEAASILKTIPVADQSIDRLESYF